MAFHAEHLHVAVADFEICLDCENKEKEAKFIKV